jgi:hypothetical protein
MKFLSDGSFFPLQTFSRIGGNRHQAEKKNARLLSGTKYLCIGLWHRHLAGAAIDRGGAKGLGWRET